ncbi:synaptonemal complex central element protein 2 isoform X1 [Brienomyrus brachyistius]|uniref:synaptonemal complex central element protein 2 isoform X1 n=2 Tax=Brienomyrus brachyistius TaxID=42636 RepID=UPI0020B2FBA7|nr:synaptonemal complex central element protein 2 isoform X1 [Brienomyrus brachyistius]
MVMDQFFVGKMASNSQSTPKPTDHSAIPESEEQLEPDLGRSSLLSLDESHEQKSSDDSGISIPGGDADCEFRSENSVYFSTLSLRIDEIGKKTQDLIEKINESRAVDQEIMNSFQEKLMDKVSEVCQQVQGQMFSTYEENSRLMEDRLRELSEVLDQSSQLSAELQSASLTLVAISKGLQRPPEQ